jgi:hypothetical protein
VTPDSLAGEPWRVVQAGTVSGRLWADLGQDYLRLDTGENGVNRSYYYELSGDDGQGGKSTWGRMDFREGLVLEMRARIGSESTAASAASLFLGDGDSGSVSLELTGTYVGLQGLGGNAGQVDYSESLHAGFSTGDWHDYRLVIASEGGAGSAVLAELYLDGDYSQPILSQWLDPALADAIRFGDLTGVNNGTLDVDYLRFAQLPEPCGLICLAIAFPFLGQRGKRCIA